jgi:hypothetical protein
MGDEIVYLYTDCFLNRHHTGSGKKGMHVQGTLIAPDDAVLTVEEVAAWLRVKPSWVTAHAARRRRPYLPCFKAGRYPRFLRSAILKFVAELSQNKINS